ncbi:hypothetical protein [Amycolatopsis sp. H20-H5]|uniref:hypothetical protein n=1 Tax=Amycolatopsis sp. H20-H5 TaxID=3046309 RepID=UPI002DB93EB6|nr:hypothetical protein [Amycolatopsis sp. H20-H5]MEC3975714.1 hypothetical protein [Amycolatopsis sp. H20-H5]
MEAFVASPYLCVYRIERFSKFDFEPDFPVRGISMKVMCGPTVLAKLIGVALFIGLLTGICFH